MKKRTANRPGHDPNRGGTRSMAMMGAVIRGVDRLSPKLGAHVAARVFLTPRRARIPERERGWLEQARPDIFSAGRFQLSGHRWGASGPPVLFVHGWEGRGSQLGGLALAVAAQGFRSITIDLPAHGSSKGAQTNLLEFAEAIAGLVKDLGGVAGIVAHSFGAAGATVALRETLSVGRLVYLAPCEDFDHFPKVFGHWLGLSPHLSDRMRRSVEGRLGVAMADLRGGLLAPDMKTPLLVIHDEDDNEVPWQDGKTYAEAWPGARLLTTRGLGHRRILREAEVLASVAAFFNEER